ncbi:discoidin domain-containing protein [Arthrobacter livingstonensis]|nr:discoidin domain-containing protein [Arthrobacter livingstonensis]
MFAGASVSALVAAMFMLGAAAPANADPVVPPPGAGIADSHYTLLDVDSQSAAYPAPPSLDGTATGAFDGDYSTQWASNYNGGNPDPMPHYITFDTGAEHTLTGLGYSVKVQGNGPVKDVEVLTTDDAGVAADGKSTKWASAGTATFHQPTSNTEIQYVTFAQPVTARYVEFKVLDAVNGSNNASASEIVVYSTDDTSALPAGKAITNAQYAVLGKDSEAASNGDGSAEAAFDQNYSTQWASEWQTNPQPGFPHWITFDVGGSFDLTGLGYSVKVQGNGPVEDVKVFTTDDAAVAKDPNASGWTQSGTATFAQPTSNTEIQYVDFSKPVKARYVRFEAENSINGSANASASEIVAYSTDSDTTPAPTTPSGPPSPYTVKVDSVNSSGWKYPDDTPASPFTDKDGTFHFGESHANYGNEADGSNGNIRQWNWYTGVNIDTAGPDAALNASGTNPDTTNFCNSSPTGKESTKAPEGSGYKQPNYCDITQMWVDPDTGDWYGLVHNEFTPQPFGDGLHYDAIDYAVSHDQGKTWSIPGHAITTPYSTVRGDTATFPEQTYYYGDGDPRLYVDQASGYFYAFYGSRVVNKSGSWVAFYEHVARAPIADKMATGSWQKWYDGAWTQPGVGGKESNMTPVTESSTTGYTAPDKEYNPNTPGSAQQQITNGQMPATSPLFVMDVTYDAYLGLYIGEPQNPDQSGTAPQEFYATKNLATQKWFKLGDTGKAYTTASWYRWFIDPANKTNSAVVGKSFRSYCSFGCMNNSSAQYANITIDVDKPAAAIDTTKAYTIANGDKQLLTVTAAGTGLTSAATADKAAGAWTFAASGDGAYTITDQAGVLLGVDASKTSDRAWGTPLTLTAKDAAGVGQQWFIVPNTSPTTGEATGSFRLVNRYSGLVLGIGSAKAATTPGRTWDQKTAAAGGLTTAAEQTLTLAVYQGSGTTTTATTVLKDSRGNPLAGGTASYYASGAWHTIGTTGIKGTVDAQIPPGSYSFAMTYNGTRQQVNGQVVSGISQSVEFHTALVNVWTQSHTSTPIGGASASYYAAGEYHPITTPNANDSRIVQAQMLPGTYSFQNVYNGTREQKKFTVLEPNPNNGANSSQSVYFHTALVNVGLQSSKGAALTADSASYYAGSWRDMTGAQAEMLPGTYSFAVTYNGMRSQKQYTVIEPNPNNHANATQTVAFATTLVNVQTQSVTGAGKVSGIISGAASFYAGSWRNITTENPNNKKIVQTEMLPGTYSFADVYNGKRVQKQAAVGTGPNQIVYFNYTI